jgi:hypothetical protein
MWRLVISEIVAISQVCGNNQKTEEEAAQFFMYQQMVIETPLHTYQEYE